MSKDEAWRRMTADWRDVVLVCRKCSRKLDGGFGPQSDETLAKALRKALARAEPGAPRKVKTRRRPLAVVEVGCLDVCPKGAVLAMRGSAPGLWHLVPRGADLRDVIVRLGLSDGVTDADRR